MYDDVNGERIPGLERFAHLVDLEEPLPLTFLEQYALTECTAELYLVLRRYADAAGDGPGRLDVRRHRPVHGTGCQRRPEGLDCRYDTDERWSLPNPTGLGVFAGYCPPHYPDAGRRRSLRRTEVRSGGPFHPDTPGPWKESSRVRESAQVHTRRIQGVRVDHGPVHLRPLREVPRHRPGIFILTYLQAHHLELEFYDHHLVLGAYLRTQADHMARWHGVGEPSP